MTQVSTLTPIRQLLELKHDWGVVAFRPNGGGSWAWYLDPLEVQAFRQMVDEGVIVSAHRRDADGTRMVAKLRGKGS